MPVQQPNPTHTPQAQAPAAVNWAAMQSFALKVWLVLVIVARWSWRALSVALKFLLMILGFMLTFFAEFFLAFVGGAARQQAKPNHAQRMSTRRQMGES